MIYPLVPLRELGEIVSGSTPDTSIKEYWYGDIPWITPADLTDHNEIFLTKELRRITEKGYKSCSTSLIPPGSIVFSSRAPIGHCAVTTYPLCTNQGFKNLIPNKRLDSVFGYFALKFYTPQLEALGRGATFTEINKEIFGSFSIPLPPITEQKRIAAILQKADRIRQLRRYARQLSEGYLQSVFLEMFGDPASNPRGFTTKKLAEILSKERFALVDGPFGSHLKANEYTESGIRVIRVNNIKPNNFNFEDIRYISEKKYLTIKRSTVRPGDIVMAKVGNTIGKTCIFPNEISYAVLTANVCKISTNPNIVHPFFTGFQMNLDYCQKQIRNLSGDTAKPMINLQNLKELNLMIPTLNEQQRFIQIATDFGSLNNKFNESERQAEQLFQSLLHQAFTDG